MTRQYLSPGVFDREQDYSTNVVAVSTASLGLIGTFNKGPIGVPTLITSSPELVSTFGTSIKESISWLSARAFLRYGSKLWVTRVAGSSAATAKGTILDNNNKPFIKVEAKDPGTFYNTKTQVVVALRDQLKRTFSLNVYYDGLVVESYTDVSFLISDSAYFVNIINDASSYIQVEDVSELGSMPDFQSAACYLLGGNDGIIQTNVSVSKSATCLIGDEEHQDQQITLMCNTIGAAGNSYTVSLTKPETADTELQVALNKKEILIVLGTDSVGVLDPKQNTVREIAYRLSNLANFSVIKTNKLDAVISIENNTTYQFTGGQDAVDSDGVGEREIYKALELYSNPEHININLLCIPGYAYPAAIKRALTLCEDRGDCFFLVDPPFGLTRNQVVDWHNGNNGEFAAFNSSFGSLYWPWVQEFDEYINQYRWLPPSGIIAGQYAYNDSVGEPWFAPAGLNRGLLQNAIKVEAEMTQADRDVLYSDGNCINPIANFEGIGIAIWGQKTLQRKSSALDRVNVRRLLLYIRKAIALSSKYVLFEQNDYLTWGNWIGMVTPFMQNILSRRGVYAFKIVMDSTTVTQEHIDANTMPGVIWLQPTKTAEFIPLDFILTKTGASFD